MTNQPPKLLALDFDGVICDGMAEYFESSLRAHHACFDRTPGPGQREELFARFAALRPAVETGWEMLVLIALLGERDPSGCHRRRAASALGRNPRRLD